MKTLDENKVDTFSRKDTSLLNQWWWTVDHWALGAVLVLISLGVVMSFAGSPAVADRLNLPSFYFVKRHFVLLIPTLLALVCFSLMSPKAIRRSASLIYIGTFIAMIATLWMGLEVKGARRWINLAGFSLQASEFAKPTLVILIAWMLAEKKRTPDFPGFLIAFGLMAAVAAALLLQPDLGMTVVVVSTWMTQVFIAGLPLSWVFAFGLIGLGGLVGAYFVLPHVARRIDPYLFPDAATTSPHDMYQVQKSLDAFSNGGLFGTGPGEGILKRSLPDAHADFIFAVTGEEFGFFVCLLVLGLFFFIVIRFLFRALQQDSLFILLAATGLALQFGLQAFINMASALHMIPTKGMTLPFISYGGSSMLAVGISVGMLLALTRRHSAAGETL